MVIILVRAENVASHKCDVAFWDNNGYLKAKILEMDVVQTDGVVGRMFANGPKEI